MGLPKKKLSRTRRDKRRTHDALTATGYVKCSHCGEACLPHRICGKCGYYKGQNRLAKSA